MLVLLSSAFQMAGAAVKKATETLVKAAQQASLNVEEEEYFMKTKVTGKVLTGFRQELEIQEEIVRKQRELVKAMGQLSRIRRENKCTVRVRELRARLKGGGPGRK